MRLFFIAALLSFAFQSQTMAQSQWQLVNDQSKLSFLTTKNTHITERSHFTQLSGSFDGKLAKLSVDLTSLDSLIPIRNERMLTILFEADKFPAADVSVSVPADLQKEIQGEYADFETQLEATISLHGQSKKMPVMVVVNKMGDTLTIISAGPILIQASDFLLSDGIQRLQEIAKLQAISHTVPVSFKLVYKK